VQDVREQLEPVDEPRAGREKYAAASTATTRRAASSASSSWNS
jgi:hypothetical protein